MQAPYTNQEILVELIRRGESVEYCGYLYVPLYPGSKRIAYRRIDIAATMEKACSLFPKNVFPCIHLNALEDICLSQDPND